MAKRGANIKVCLVSEEGTGERYYTKVNKRTQTEKLRLRKYDKKLRKHCWFKEDKIKD